MEKIAFIKAFLCYVGYPLLAGNFFFAFIENLNNYKSMILMIIATVTGIILMLSKFIDLLKKILDFDTYYSAYKDKNGKTKTPKERQVATFYQIVIAVIVFCIIVIWFAKH